MEVESFGIRSVRGGSTHAPCAAVVLVSSCEESIDVVGIDQSSARLLSSIPLFVASLLCLLDLIVAYQLFTCLCEPRMWCFAAQYVDLQQTDYAELFCFRWGLEEFVLD